jgi:hypothetical protein
MTTHLGFYNTSSTRTHVRFQFSTHASAGANVAPLSAFEAADIRIYKATDGAGFSATQRSSSNGITMTSPFDSLTGYHDVDIDLTDNTDAGFYASGCFYSIVLAPDTETIDSQTITGIPLGYFEIAVPAVNATQWAGGAIPAPAVTGVPKIDLTYILGTLLTETAGQIAAAFKQFFNVATPVGTVNLVPANLTQIDGAATNGNNAVLKLKQLNIVNTTGQSGIQIDTTNNANGIEINAAYNGIYITSGVDADTVSLNADGTGSALFLGSGGTGKSINAPQDIALPSGDLDDQLNALPTAIENADAYLDRANAIETGLTPRQAMRLEVAAAAGKLSGADTTTVVIRNAVADSKDRITATVDADGNRTSITTDVS